MAKAISIPDSVSRLDPHPSLTMPARRSRRGMSARNRVRVLAQV